jgi:hypothetical protein
MGKKKVKSEVKEVKEVEAEEVEAKDIKVETAAEPFVTADIDLADKLLSLGFHITSQKVIEGVLTYTFKEPKDKINEALK